MRSKHLTALIAVLITMVMLVAGCGSGTSSQTSSNSGKFDWQKYKGKTIHVALVTHPFTDSIIPLIPEFEKKTGIKVKYDQYTEEQYREKLVLDLSSGSATYDAFMTGPVDDWRYAPAKWVEPLDKYINDKSMTAPDYNFNDFYPALIKANRWNLKNGSGVGAGSIYALPLQCEGYSLAYRKDVFDHFGLKPPTTWDELYQSAKFLNGKEFEGKKLIGFTSRGDKTVSTIRTGFSTIFFSYGGKYVDENGKPAINSPEGIAATEMWAKIMKDGSNPATANWTWYEDQNSMANGESAMNIDSDHMSGVYEDPKQSKVAGKVGYALPPKGPNGKIASNMWIWSMGINAASKNKDAAWYFVQWATSKDTLVKSALKGNLDPARISVSKDPQVVAMMSKWDNYNNVYQENLSKYANVLEYPASYTNQLGDRWALAIQEVVLGQKDAKTSLTQAAKDMQKIIEDNK